MSFLHLQRGGEEQNSLFCDKLSHDRWFLTVSFYQESPQNRSTGCLFSCFHCLQGRFQNFELFNRPFYFFWPELIPSNKYNLLPKYLSQTYFNTTLLHMFFSIPSKSQKNQNYQTILDNHTLLQNDYHRR